MPVYEYECLKCGGRFEDLQKMSDAPLKKHNGCGGRVKRLLSAPAFQFKGTGWYVTDYARKNNGPSGDGKGEGKKDASSETKSETKPEARSETKSEKATDKSESKPADTKK